MRRAGVGMRVLCIGDVVGKPGRKALADHLPPLVKSLAADLVIVNIENASGGFGPEPKAMEELMGLPIHVFTTGSHIWDKKEFVGVLDLYPMVIRPANYPPKNPGRGWLIHDLPEGRKAAVIQLQGRVFMETLDCPFRALDAILAEIPPEVPVLVDFHAEATSEKQAFGHYADGRVSAVFGTHTHVPTADARVLSGGTGYLTDAGMCGAYDSVIGFDKEIILQRFLRQTPVRFEVARGPAHLSGVLFNIEDRGRKCLSAKHILRPAEF